MIKLVSLGADPEFFIRRVKDGTYMPSSIITSGTKDMPEDTGTKGFFIHKDNLTVEGNIPPAKNKAEFVSSMKFLKDIINTIAQTKGCELVCEDQIEFKPRFLNLSDAQEFGCSGFNNAWAYNVNQEISTPKLNSNLRVAGFHYHIGYEIIDSKYTKKQLDTAIGRAFDLFLTLPSDGIKYSAYRRDTYGQYGSVRRKSYGVECRALGGYFAKDEYLEWGYDQILKMFNWLNTENNIEKILAVRHSYYMHTQKLKSIKKQLKLEETVIC